MANIPELKEGQMYGYAGKILRINLTDSTTETIDSHKYLPEWIGGRALAHAIFWDEVGPGVGAFDPDNKLIFADGPAGGTAIPTGGRAVMCGIGANNLPEQYTSSSIGGWVGTVMKFAGYDAIIIEGKAPKHTYLLIENDKVSFLDASGIWGMLISETQEAIFLAHGRNTFSMVIGPAGENLIRDAAITTSNDHTLSKAGFGAVFGSKNLKGIAFRGTGSITPYDIDKVLELRIKIGDYHRIPNPVTHQTALKSIAYNIPAPDGWDFGKLACSPGCNSRCQRLMMNMNDAFTGEKISTIEKCVSPLAFTMENDCYMPVGTWVQSPRNPRSMGAQRSWGIPYDKTDPDYPIISEMWGGDTTNLWKGNFNKGSVVDQLCKEYGIDKWDFIIWNLTWVSMCRQEGLLDDIDFGMDPDPDSEAFCRHFIKMIVYRNGPMVKLVNGTERPLGDVFAEHMARAIRMLGKEKYGDSIYHGRYSNILKKYLDLPVSLESGWGQCTHWQGRGWQGCQKWFWTSNAILHMVNTRDAMSMGHTHLTTDELRAIKKEGICHSETQVNAILRTENVAVLTDSVPNCEWQSNEMFYPEQNAEQFYAATGEDLTPEELLARANRARLLFRAILMRNHGRCRDMEVEDQFPFMTYPDPAGEVVTWDEWNDLVDMYYEKAGFDLETGWPYRSTWEAAGLGHIADEMEKIGMLPKEGGNPEYKRKENPLNGHIRKEEPAYSKEWIGK